MRATHTFQIEARCPHGGRDIYAVTVQAERLVKVEDILAAARKLTAKPIYQEALTESLARELGAAVRTVGYHSGVRTEVEA